MRQGDILDHEFMGEVVELGADVKNLQVGDRVVVPFPIACGNCFFCQREMYSLCDNSNPNAVTAEKLWGQSPAGIFGYSHLVSGYSRGRIRAQNNIPLEEDSIIAINAACGNSECLYQSK